MDEITQSIILWGGVAGAVAAIWAAISKVAKLFKSGKEYFTQLRTDVDTLLKHDNAQYMAILRLTVMSDNVPLSERIIAGKEYTENGGNGDVRHYYETVLKPHDTLKSNKED